MNDYRTQRNPTMPLMIYGVSIGEEKAVVV